MAKGNISNMRNIICASYGILLEEYHTDKIKYIGATKTIATGIERNGNGITFVIIIIKTFGIDFFVMINMNESNDMN